MLDVELLNLRVFTQTDQMGLDLISLLLEEGSWYHFFKEQGYEVKAHLVGLGEYPEVQKLYIQHLEEIIE